MLSLAKGKPMLSLAKRQIHRVPSLTYAAKCTVTMEDIADQLETMLDGSVIEIVIE